MQLFQAIEQHTQHEPLSFAIITPEIDISYHDLNLFLLRSRLLFNNHNIQPGDRVGLLFKNPVNHFIASLALLQHGCCQVAFHQSSTQTQLNSFTESTKLKLLLCDEIPENYTHPKIQFSLQALSQQTLSENPSARQVFKHNLSDIALLIIGSGTTANSKLIPVTFFALEQQINRDIDAHHLHKDERFLALSPISYYTSTRRMLACIQAKACAVFYDNNNVNLLQFCNRIKVGHLSLVLNHAQQIIKSFEANNINPGKHKLPYLKTLFIGASPISESIRQKLLVELTENVFIFYGPNEIGASTCAPLDQNGNKTGTIGLPCKGVTLEIVDQNDQPCAQGTSGRIRLKADGLFQHYEDNCNELTRKALRDGWFYPNDLAYIDADGHVIFQGREDDLIIYQGANIYPRQIEHVLEEYPAVKEAAVFGIAFQESEQAPVAVITLHKETGRQQELQKIKAFCREKLGWQTPVSIKIVDELPKNAAGKILKRELKAAYTG